MANSSQYSLPAFGQVALSGHAGNGPYLVTSSPPSYNQAICACGSPATRVFSNPKGISYNLDETTPALALCSGCDFRFTVMRAAGRSEEFLTEYEEKHKVMAEAEGKRQEEIRRHYYEQVSQQQEAYQKAKLQQMQEYYSGQQNVAGQLMGSGDGTCTVNVQSPAEEPKPAWWKRYFGGGNG
jgi:hypothetical protein